MLALKRAFDPEGTAQPRQGDPDPAALRRVRPHAREEGPAALSRTGAILMAVDAALARLVDQVQTARVANGHFRIVGGGTKDFYGNALQGAPLDVRPAGRHLELRTDRAGGDACAAARRWPNSRPPLASTASTWPSSRRASGTGATVGGMVAAGLAGPSRAAAGSVRDHLLGATLLNGRGEVLTFGGQVMKNVAGYDVSRVLAGSMGVARRHLRGLAEGAAGGPRPPRRCASRWTRRRRSRALNDWGGEPLPISASAWWDGMLVVRLARRARGRRGRRTATRRRADRAATRRDLLARTARPARRVLHQRGQGRRGGRRVVAPGSAADGRADRLAGRAARRVGRRTALAVHAGSLPLQCAMPPPRPAATPRCSAPRTRSTQQDRRRISTRCRRRWRAFTAS